MSAPPASGKNALGLGPNVTALLLGAACCGVYYGSTYVLRKWVMQDTGLPEPPSLKSFRDLKNADQSGSNK